MPLQEVTFYNVVGDEVNLTNLVNQMIDYYDQKREIGETRLTDFNEGSEIRNLLEAFAVLCYAILEDENEAGKLPFIETSYGTYLDEIGNNPFINLHRNEGASAEGIVTFTLTTAQNTDIIIPADTLLEADNGLTYVTDNDTLIIAGETSEECGVSCLVDGYEGNINSGELTTISDETIDTSLISVNNTEALTGGVDYEEDEQYRVRLLENVRSEGFGTLGYYNALAEGVEGVHDAKLVTDATYTRKILVNGFTKPTADNILLDVLTVFSDMDNIVLGHSFTVDTPDYSNINLTFDLNVLSEMDSDNINNILTKMIDGGDIGWGGSFTGLNIGENLTHEYIENCLESIYLIDSFSVKITGQSSEFVSTNITENQVVKLNNLTVNQTVVG